MNQQHLDALARESSEAIADLNTSLLALEADPADDDAMDDVFRIAHTLKGNFAAAGFEEPSTVAHALEDLLDEIRDGSLSATPERMDIAFEAVDVLSTAVDQIASDGAVDIESAKIHELIRTQIGDGQAAPQAGTDSTEPGADAHSMAIESELVADATGRVLAIQLAVDSADMPAVDCLLALNRIDTVAAQLVADPPRSELESMTHVEAVTALVEIESKEAITDVLSGFPGIELESCRDVTDPVGSDDGAERGGEPESNPDRGGAKSASVGPAGGSNEVKSIRIDVDRLDELYGLVEGLVTGRIKLRRSIEAGEQAAIESALDDLEKITRGLQDTVMDMRLIPLKNVVTPLPRLVRDLSREQGKEIEFEMEGTDIELDRTILSELGDPLVHIVRNAVDHGIEAPVDRSAADKERTGHIRLEAVRERDHVRITVSDDGRGLDRQSIEQTAIDQGLAEPNRLDRMTDSEVYELIFHPGFSTTEEVTDVSGRGVGMDVVMETVQRLDGSVRVESEAGSGTAVHLRVPVSVAIAKMLFLAVGDRTFGLPIKQIDELERDAELATIRGRETVHHDDDLYPVVDLAAALSIEAGRGSDSKMIVHIRPEYRAIALRCDRVIGQEEVVVKPLEGRLSDVDGLSGTAVLGDGDVVPILDVRTLGGDGE